MSTYKLTFISLSVGLQNASSSSTVGATPLNSAALSTALSRSRTSCVCYIIYVCMCVCVCVCVCDVIKAGGESDKVKESLTPRRIKLSKKVLLSLIGV